MQDNDKMLAASRPENIHVIHLSGDSIMRGYAFGVFAEEIDQDDPRALMGRPSSIMTSLLKDQMISNYRVIYAGNNGLPLYEGSVHANIRDLRVKGVLRSGDLIVIEDAGEHRQQPREYQKHVSALIERFAEVPGVRILVVSTCDAALEGGGYPPDQVSFRLKFRGLSHNDAMQLAVSEATAKGIDVSFLDFRRTCDRIRAVLKSNYQLDILLADRIHINFWGYIALCLDILHHFQLLERGEVKLERLGDFAERHADLVRFGASDWTPSLARAVILLLPTLVVEARAKGTMSDFEQRIQDLLGLAPSASRITRSLVEENRAFQEDVRRTLIDENERFRAALRSAYGAEREKDRYLRRLQMTVAIVSTIFGTLLVLGLALLGRAVWRGKRKGAGVNSAA
jgi:hypothetical protein